MATNDKDQTSGTDVIEETPEVAADTAGLVKVFKDGVTLHVHPTCVASHAKIGWKVVSE